MLHEHQMKLLARFWSFTYPFKNLVQAKHFATISSYKDEWSDSVRIPSSKRAFWNFQSNFSKPKIEKKIGWLILYDITPPRGGGDTDVISTSPLSRISWISIRELAKSILQNYNSDFSSMTQFPIPFPFTFTRNSGLLSTYALNFGRADIVLNHDLRESPVVRRSGISTRNLF